MPFGSLGMLLFTKRRIFNTGHSRTFALPLDWSGRNADHVFIIYGDYLLIIPEESVEQIDLQRLQSLLKELLNKDGGLVDPSGEAD